MNMSEPKTALVLTSSIRGKASNSRLLTQFLLDQLSFAHGSLIVNKRDLSMTLPLIDAAWCEANSCHADKCSNDQKQTLTLSDVLIAELESADIVVIAAPMYNFNIPVGLKTWIDHIMRVGVTFKYMDNGPIGLLSDKPVYIVITTGGTELGGNSDYASGYLRHIFQFMGIHNLNFIDGAKYDMNNADIAIQTHDRIRRGLANRGLINTAI